MRSALLSVPGLKNELCSCATHSVSVHGLKNELYPVSSALMFRFMD